MGRFSIIIYARYSIGLASDAIVLNIQEALR